MEKNILVTGGAGYVGSHTCQALAKAGYTPVAYDNLSRGNEEAVQWGPLEIGDLMDEDRLVEVIQKHRPRAVLHFAALAYVGESVEDPEPYYQINLAGTLSLLRAMRRCLINVIVFSSSCSVYGIPKTIPLTENHPRHPASPYGRSKYTVEAILEDYHRAYGLRFVSLRYFNACGADPDGRIGEKHNPETHLIPLALMAASGKLDHLKIFGTDYATPDGTCIRDYIHVSDLSGMHVRALDYLSSGGLSDFFNLGIGRGFSVREIVSAVERVTGQTVPVVESPRRPGDPAALVADSDKALNILNFQPEFTKIEDMIETAWAWFKHQWT